MKICSIDNCEKVKWARGWCVNHYALWNRWGSPHINKENNIRHKKYSSLEDYLSDGFSIGNDDECWEWKKHRSKQGYGSAVWNKKSYKSHRLAYEFHKGKIPENICVLHKCDNPPCGNPAHLFLGTNKDNVNDRVKKGRNGNSLGENSHLSKLKNNEVLKIKKLLAKGTHVLVISRLYDVTKETIYGIRDGKTWKHVTIP